MDVALVEALLHQINGMKGASYGAEAMCDGRGTVEEANIWKKCGGYGEVDGESLERGWANLQEREFLASKRRNSM